MSKKILILGGCGHVGSRLYNYLRKLKYDVTSVDIEWFGCFINSNIKDDYSNLSIEFLKDYDILVLLAAHVGAKMCEGDFNSTYANNVTNFINLVNKLDPKKHKLIYASSASVYCNVSSEVNEKYSTSELGNFYDYSKFTIDLFIQLMNIEFYGLRFGTVCGSSPNMKNDIIINAMTISAIENDCVNIISPDTIRPILGINDLCRAMETIIKSEIDLRGIYNLASFNHTIGEIGTRVGKEMDVKVNICDPQRFTEVLGSHIHKATYNIIVSCKKFKQNFGFLFQDTIETITKDIKDNYSSVNKASREYNITYP